MSASIVRVRRAFKPRPQKRSSSVDRSASPANKPKRAKSSARLSARAIAQPGADGPEDEQSSQSVEEGDGANSPPPDRPSKRISTDAARIAQLEAEAAISAQKNQQLEDELRATRAGRAPPEPAIKYPDVGVLVGQRDASSPAWLERLDDTIETHPLTFPTDASRLEYAKRCMEQAPRRWLTSLIKEAIVADKPLSWQQFKDEFKKAYGPVIDSSSVRESFSKLQQHGPVAGYLAAFEELRAIELPEANKLTVVELEFYFRRGLSTELRTHLLTIQL